MNTSVTKFTYELIFNVLPIKSSNNDISEVENDPLFNNCRVLLFNLSTTYSIDPSFEETMRLIDMITKQQKTSSLSDKTLSSLLILLRLLSDTSETYWKQQDVEQTPNYPHYLEQEDEISKNLVGFSTQKLCYHVTRPKALQAATARSFISTLSFLKQSTASPRSSKRTSMPQSSSQNSPASTVKSESIPQPDQRSVLKAIDANIDFLCRFISAANPAEFYDFINNTVVAPLTISHRTSDIEIIQYLDFFSSYYVTNTNLPKFLQMVAKVLENLKKPSHQEYVLMCSSQALITWILSRPDEYVALVTEIINSSKDENAHAVFKYSSSLFDEVHSNFNVSYLLTTTAGSNAAISEFKSSPPPSDVPSPISSSGSSSYFSSDPAEVKRTQSSSRNFTDFSGYPSSWDPTIFSTATGLLFPGDEVANLSILRFLTVMLLFQPQTFEEMNLTSFKHIPDEQKPRNDESMWRSSSEEEKKKPQSQLSKLRQSNHRKLQSLKFPSFTSSSKKIKFLTTLIKNINGSQIVSDTSLLDTLRTTVILFRVASSIHLADPESPVVAFARRLLFVVGDSLQLCDVSQSKKNPVIARCLSRNPSSQTKLHIAFFAPALIMEPQMFIARLAQFTQNKHTGFKHLRTITEGFKLFFGIPNVPKSSLEMVLRSTEFFKKTLVDMSEVILTASQRFSEEMSIIVEGILNGSVKSDSVVSRISGSSSPSIPTAAIHPPLQRESPSRGDAGSNTSSSSLSSTTSSHGDRRSSSKGPIDRSEILMPHARRASGSMVSESGKTGMKAPFSPEGEKSLHGMRSQLESIHKSVKSPLRFSRSREPSDESLQPMSLQSLQVKTSGESSSVFTHKATQTDLMDARATLVNIISVYQRMVQYYFVTLDDVGPPRVTEDYNLLIKPLFVGLIDDQVAVQETARSFTGIIASYALKLENDDENTKDKNDIKLVLYKGAAYLITLISTKLFNLTLRDSKREQLLDVISKYLNIRLVLKSSFSNETLRDIEGDTYELLQGATGRGLLASLYTHEPRIHKLLRACFKNFLRELDSHDDIMGNIEASKKHNRNFFQSMCQDNYVSTGAVAFQRRLRSDILKHFEFPDKMSYDTLILMYNQWLALSRKTQLNPTEASHFRNVAGIIAACCGTFLTIDSQILATSPAIANMQKEVHELVDYFLSMQCLWLNDADLLTRENSKDIISTELHPLAFKILFNILKQRIGELESLDLSLTQNDSSFLFLEQIILIVRTMLEREDSKGELILVSLELLSLIDQLFKIVEDINHNSSRYYKAVIHLSKMLRSFENAEKSICISGYLLIKNKWLRLAISWFKSTIFKEFNLENLGLPHREMDLKKRDIDYLYIDTSIESSKALAYITKDLMLEVPLSISESELKRSKAVTFGNYFSTLLKGLEKSSCVENYPTTLRHKIGVLNDNIITSLTNLLNANVDVGLKYALPIGYSTNQSIKVAFLKVFVEIISNFDIHKDRSLTQKNQLVEEFVQESVKYPHIIPLAARVCPANDIDALSSGMLTVFEVKHSSHIIVVELIKDEIQNAFRYADVLRRNSCATRALSMFSRLKGGDYLCKTLKPVLEGIINNDEAFEVEKMTEDHPDAERNAQLFTKYLTMLIDSIVDSVPSFPPEFFILCQTIFLSVREKFPGYEKVAVGSFIFLRYFCPALVSPDAENIVDIVTPKQKRSFVIMAKVVQNIANGCITSMKWPLLKSRSSFLLECSEKVSKYLTDIANPERAVSIKILNDKKVGLNEFNYMHRYIYQHGLEIRSEIIAGIKSKDDFDMMKRISKFTDNLLSALGQPRMEFRNEIPPSIRDKMDEYPELYDFMSRHSLRTFDFKDDVPFVREAVSSEGLPIIIFTYKLLQRQTCDTEALTYRTFQVYSKVWASKHLFVVDCTGFDAHAADDRKLLTFFFNLIPNEAAQNCAKFYYHNMTEDFLKMWLPIFKAHNPYLKPYHTPHVFINSDSNGDLIKSLKLTSFSNEVYSDVRVTLHEVSLYDPTKERFTPITMKIGNKYVQMISETPYRLKIPGIDDVVEINFNNVYEIGTVASTVVSFETGVPSEFTVNFDGGFKLIFCSSKYLEIIKIFYYAQARIEEEYDSENLLSPKQGQSFQNDEKENHEILGSLLLVIYAGFCSDDENVKNISYNVLAATQESFGLDFGCKLRVSPEVHVPHDTSAFCGSLLKGLARTAPELSLVVWNSILEGLSDIFEVHHVPHVINTLTPWVPNLYKYVYLADDEKGPENVSFILRTLIRLSVRDTRLIMIYSQCIWSTLILEADLVSVIVDEIVNHSIDRDSEGADWKNVISLLTRVSTVEVCSEVVNRILRVSRSFLPSLKMESSTNSWSELIILVNITVALFFDSLLLAQLYLPEVLYIVSLLIDVGPSDMRLALHKLLMNVCQSLSTNEYLSASKRATLSEVGETFSRHKMRFMSGFSQDKGRILKSFSASSFLSKFTTLEHFINSIILLMESSSETDCLQWRAKYSKYVMDAVFNVDSFLSARAAMIIGIIGQKGISESLCKNLLLQTIKTVAEPYVSDELIFFVISHSFTYSKAVLGLQPSSPLLRQLFWLATTFSQSTNHIFYHGGLLFMANAIRRISCLDRASSKVPLPATLFRYREFAEPLFVELEAMVGVKWTVENFPHIALNLISKGLLVPYIKTTAVDCLKLFLTLSYKDLTYAPCDDYLCYLLFMYLVSRPQKFSETLEELEVDDELVYFDEQNFVTRRLLEWMESDSEASLITLYQASVYFASGVSDELSKIRYLLLLNRMVKTTPKKVILVYSLIRTELKRISTLEVQSDFPHLVFSIAQTLVKEKEYANCELHLSQTNSLLKARNLFGIQMIEFPFSASDSMGGGRENPYAVYERKKLTVKIMSRMVSSDYEQCVLDEDD